MKLILSSEDVPDIFVGAKAKSDNSYQDFEDGPINIGDISKGLNYQIWWAEIEDNNKAFLMSNNQAREIFIEQDGISELSLSFDGNGRPIVAFVANNTTFLKWFNSASGIYEITNFGNNLKSPKVFMDDKRPYFQGESDVIFLYVKTNTKELAYRLQGDRFGVEYIIASNVSGKILRFGMLSNYRLGIRLSQGNEPTRM